MMIQAIWRKALADIRHNWGQFLASFLILVLATMTLTVAIIVQQTADNPWDETFERTNGAHVWLVASDMDVDLTPVAQHEAVSETTNIIPAIDNHPIIFGEDKKDIFIYAPGENPKVAIPLVVEGRWMDAAAKEEIVLDFSFASYYEIDLGDHVEILTAEGPLSLEVVGMAVTSHWMPYSEVVADLVPSVAYVSEPVFTRIEPDRSAWRQALGLRLHDPDTSKAFVQEAHALVDGQLQTSIEWQWVQSIANFANQINVLFLGFFSMLALITVGFIVANIIGGQLVSQFRAIGILKSIGFTPNQVMLLFIVQQLLVGLVAAVIGVGLGLLIAPGFTGQMATLLNTDAPNLYAPGMLITIILLIEGAVLFFTVLPAWRGGHINTVAAINTGFQRNLKRASLPAKLARALHLPPTVVLGVKDTTARPVRTILTVIALVLSISVAIIAVGSDSAIRAMASNSVYSQGTPADMMVDRNFVDESIARADITGQDGVKAFYSEVLTFGWSGGFLENPVQIRALADDYASFDFKVREGRMIENEGEAVAGFGLLNLVDAKVGDVINLTVEGQPLRVKVVGAYAEITNTSIVMLTSLETFRAQVDPAAQPQRYGLDLAANVDRKALREHLLTGSDGQYDIVITEDKANAQALLLRDITLGLAVLLILIASVNLMATSWLNIRESFRDIAIQKSIGMTPGQIIRAVMSGVVFVTLIAFIIGIPIGLLIYQGFADAVSVQSGAGPEFGKMDWVVLPLLLPLFIVVAIVSSLLPARHAAQLEVIDALRYE